PRESRDANPFPDSLQRPTAEPDLRAPTNLPTWISSWVVLGLHSVRVAPAACAWMAPRGGTLFDASGLLLRDSLNESRDQGCLRSLRFGLHSPPHAWPKADRCFSRTA